MPHPVYCEVVRSGQLSLLLSVDCMK